MYRNLAREHGFTVNKDFVGHGIGLHFHEAPLVLHHHNDSDLRMQTGMTFTIEPILCERDCKIVEWQDGWTVVSADGIHFYYFFNDILCELHAHSSSSLVVCSDGRNAQFGMAVVLYFL